MDGSTPAGYAIRFHATAAAAAEDGWTRVVPPGRDPWFELAWLDAVMATLGPASPMSLVVAHRDGDGPVAVGVASRKKVDALSMAPAPVRRFLVAARRIWPGLLRFPALTLGFPFWGATAPLRVRDGRGDPALTAALAAALLERARGAGERVLLVHDFTGPGLEAAFPGAEACGLIGAESPPDHVFPAGVGSLQGWLERLREPWRGRFVDALAKGDAAGLTVRRVADPVEAERLFTDPVHALHDTITTKWEVHFVDLPPEFFRVATRRAPGQVRWTFAFLGGRVVGYVFGLMEPGAYYSMFLGHDPALNDTVELYTNLVLRDVGLALAEGATEVRLGTEIRSGKRIADWKAELGCTTRPRRFFAAATGPWLGALLRTFAPILFPPAYHPAPRPVLGPPGRP